MYLCKISFVTTLDIYKVYFKGRHIWEYKENTSKRRLMPYSLRKKLLRLCALRFLTKWFLIFIVDEVKNFAANIFIPQVGEWVMYWDFCKGVSHVLGSVHQKGGVHILKSSEVLKRYKVFAVNSFTEIVESRDKSFVLNLKLLFTIVDCFMDKV